MEIHQLEILRELGALGSVKAVAETLMVTPSAVSQQLALLQRTVDVPLTRKEGRNLVLTEAGQVLADAGAAVVSAMAEARGAIGNYHGTAAGRVTLSGFHSVGQAVFAPLARILDAPDQPRIELSDEDVAQQDFPALTARYDLVLAHRMDHSPRWPADRVTVIPLAHEPLDVALPAAHPLAGKPALTADDVGGEAWVTSHTGYSPADVLAAVAAVSSRELNIVHRINDYSTVAALVAAGGVVGLLPRYTAGPVLNPDIVLRPLEGISTRRRIDLLARPENLKRRSVMIVSEALQGIMAGLVEQG
ncbi:DNA-binding transcriptional LysR family regulator [Arthrobacter sp. SLBN-100]|uniref:LysR family transcriptional regulator n=1 Tax=Arthrobacter sp. SLBN-100 TaxID=2768450 RepID=UPI00114E92B4|nr:LysR family transcriptional regulator [Arthrobacter sp. SLBN-100]TQJ70007.1 DNA-binding transcriptional LysR family regulator [Arthrobacter sp. SLBN-100]